MTNSEALAQACFDGNFNLVVSLLQTGVDINAQGRNWNPLHAAIENMEIEVVRLLLDFNADTEIKCCGARALHHAIDVEVEAAAQAENPELPEPVLTRMLLKAGANSNGTDDHGRTPLQLARHLRHEKAVVLLQSQGIA